MNFRLNWISSTISHICCYLLIQSIVSVAASEEPWTNQSVYMTGFTILPAEIRKRTYYDSKGYLNANENTKMLVRVFGKFPSSGLYLKLTRTKACADRSHANDAMLKLIKGSENTVAEVNLELPSYIQNENYVYMCLHEGLGTHGSLQGLYNNTVGKPDVYPWLAIRLLKPTLPLWVHVILVIVLLMLSALFSGLNLGLLSLDKTDLKVIINTGSPRERKEALAIVSVRNHGNFLLCCLVFSNVLVNTTLTLVMDQLLTGDWQTVVVTTPAIVIIGEILPQAVCSRHGLTVGAKTIWVTKFFMFVSFPLAYPVGKLLDLMLGEEIGAVYTRDRLKELLKATRDQNGLEVEEMGIIAGALELKSKTVKDVMTPIDQMFMIPADSVLDFDALADIEDRRFTRIPIYQGKRSNVVAIINMKQLTLIDPEKKIPVNTLTEFYKTNLFFVFETEKLDVMFRIFREGNRGHMAFVQRINADGPGDPFYETIGLVTMEDVLEELLQTEIYDENDVERSQARLGIERAPHGLSYQYKKTKRVVNIPPQLAVAATQYLVTSVEPFKENRVSVPIVQRLVGANTHFLKFPKQPPLPQQGGASIFLYEAGKVADCFIMILEGKVKVQVGKEKLVYESGPFTTFGVDLLSSYNKKDVKPISDKESTKKRLAAALAKKATFVPDYTVKVLADLYILKVTYINYCQARIATEVERMYSYNPEKAAEWPDWQQDVTKFLEEDTAD